MSHATAGACGLPATKQPAPLQQRKKRNTCSYTRRTKDHRRAAATAHYCNPIQVFFLFCCGWAASPAHPDTSCTPGRYGIQDPDSLPPFSLTSASLDCFTLSSRQKQRMTGRRNRHFLATSTPVFISWRELPHLHIFGGHFCSVTF